MDRGDNDAFTVEASNLVSSASYTIDVSTDDTDIGFDSNCSDREEEVTVQSKTLHAVSLTLYGCATAGGTVTATLSRDGSTGRHRHADGNGVAAGHFDRDLGSGQFVHRGRNR